MYLQEALDFIQSYSVKRDSVDWQQVRAVALADARGGHPAQTTADTYPIIRSVLAGLGDHHSQFLDPATAKQAANSMQYGIGLVSVPQGPDRIVLEVLPGSPAQRAGVQPGDTLLDYSPGSTRLRIKRQSQAEAIQVDVPPGEFSTFIRPVAHAIGDVGYLQLATFTGQSGPQQADYAAGAREGLDAVGPSTRCGWIVDLRTDSGGNGYPMLAAVAPLMPDGPGGAFVAPSSTQPWSFQHGEFVAGGKVQNFGLQAPAHQYANEPVAVLTGPLTASSGEWVLVSFRGRPQTRSFGSPSAGVPTANTVKAMPDGANLVLTVALDADRTGRTYDSAIEPDEVVQPDWTAFGTEGDPVFKAALVWLHAQASCGPDR